MASVRTVDQLEAALTEELKWRKHEVLQYEGLASNARPHELDGIVRGGVALLYAHWEGYVKAAGCLYLEHLARLGLKLNDLIPELAALSLRGLLGLGESSKVARLHTDVVLAVREGGNQQARIPYDRAVIRTQSNLTFELFEDVMHSLGCDSNRHEIHRTLINARLLKNRNDIAHGRELYVTLADWMVMRDRVFAILADVRTQFANAAATKSYRRTVST